MKIPLVGRLFGGGANVASAGSVHEPATPVPQETPKKLTAVKLKLGDKSYPISSDGKPMSLGRHDDSDVVFKDQDVSRHHAQLRLKDGVLSIRDSGSTHGTFVNDKPIKPKEWVPIRPEDGVKLSGRALGFEVPEVDDQVSLSWPENTSFEVRAQGGNPVDIGQEGITLGRAEESDLALAGSDKVSRRHAAVKIDNGMPLIQDLNSLNGTAMNGKPLAVGGWAPVQPGSEVTLGTEAKLEFQPKMVMPDGREALINPLPDGKIRVQKVDFHTPSEEIGKLNLHSLEGHEATPEASKLKVGESYLSLQGGGIRLLTYYGTDPQGRHRLGHTDDYTPEQFKSYLDSQARHLQEREEARQQRQAKREKGAAELRQTQVRELGLDGKSYDQVAAALLKADADLAYDGMDAWPKQVTDKAVALKRAEMESDPDLKQRGLVELRMEEWQASKRGEMMLYRGLRGRYDASQPGKYWADEFGTALHTYAMGQGASESSVIGMRVPTSEAVAGYRNVGSLPGLNPYASVIKVDPGETDQQRKPKLLVSSDNPQQKWMFEAFKGLDALPEREAKRQGFMQISRDVTGQ